MAATAEPHLLRLAISCRSLSAHVTSGSTETIIAMASSGEQEFAASTRARIYRHPRCRSFWDHRVASRVGENLAFRLSQIGVFDIRLLPVASPLPNHYRRSIVSLFLSVKQAGVRVDGVDELLRDPVPDPPPGSHVDCHIKYGGDKRLKKQLSKEYNMKDLGSTKQMLTMRWRGMHMHKSYLKQNMLKCTKDIQHE